MSNISVATLLTDGARVVADSRRLCDGRRRIHDEARLVLQTYRPHRLRIIRGASADDEQQRRLELLRRFAAYPAVKMFVGPSPGRACGVCGRPIQPKETEYDIEAGAANVTVDAGCYRIFIDEIATTPRPSASI